MFVLIDQISLFALSTILDWPILSEVVPALSEDVNAIVHLIWRYLECFENKVLEKKFRQIIGEDYILRNLTVCVSYVVYCSYYIQNTLMCISCT
jgi:hypothetical protein